MAERTRLVEFQGKSQRSHGKVFRQVQGCCTEEGKLFSMSTGDRMGSTELKLQQGRRSQDIRKPLLAARLVKRQNKWPRVAEGFPSLKARSKGQPGWPPPARLSTRRALTATRWQQHPTVSSFNNHIPESRFDHLNHIFTEGPTYNPPITSMREGSHALSPAEIPEAPWKAACTG